MFIMIVIVADQRFSFMNNRWATYMTLEMTLHVGHASHLSIMKFIQWTCFMESIDTENTQIGTMDRTFTIVRANYCDSSRKNVILIIFGQTRLIGIHLREYVTAPA